MNAETFVVGLGAIIVLLSVEDPQVAIGEFDAVDDRLRFHVSLCLRQRAVRILDVDFRLFPFHGRAILRFLQVDLGKVASRDLLLYLHDKFGAFAILLRQGLGEVGLGLLQRTGIVLDLLRVLFAVELQ